MNNPDTSHQAAITGMGVISPFGLGIDKFAKGLENGDTAIGPIKRFELQDWCPAGLCATVPDFPLEERNQVLEELTGNPKESSRASPSLRLAWAALQLALDDSGIILDDAKRERTGIFLGLSRLGMDRLEFLVEKFASGRVTEIMPFRVELVHPHGTAVHLSFLYKIVGPCLTFFASCQSGVQALEAAMLFLANDHIDWALVVSADIISRFQFHAEAAAGFLSPAHDPQGAPRPYDRDADGAVLSEGGAALILERTSDAQSRRACIRANIKSLETVIKPTSFPPFVDEQPELHEVLKEILGPIDPNELDLIHADGRGIAELDRSESQGIRAVWGKSADRVPVTSIQGSLGHTGGTSALFQLVSTILAMESSKVPPIRNLEQPAARCDLDYVFGKARPAQVNKAMVLSHGWGGHHSVLVLEKK